VLAAHVVENTTDMHPAGSTVEVLLPVETKTQLLQAGKAVLQHADGVLGAHAKKCQLVVEIAPVRSRTFLFDKGTNDPCGVFHSLITEQVLSSREVHLWVAMPVGKRSYEGVGCRARAALHDDNQVPIPVAFDDCVQAVPALSVLGRPRVQCRLVCQRKSGPVSRAKTVFKAIRRAGPLSLLRPTLSIRPANDAGSQALEPLHNSLGTFHYGSRRHTEKISDKVHTAPVSIMSKPEEGNSQFDVKPYLGGAAPRGKYAPCMGT